MKTKTNKLQFLQSNLVLLLFISCAAKHVYSKHQVFDVGLTKCLAMQYLQYTKLLTRVREKSLNHRIHLFFTIQKGQVHI